MIPLTEGNRLHGRDGIMARILVVAMATLLATGIARADIANVQLGDDYFRIRYVNETLAQSVGRMELDLGYLYSVRNTTSDYLLHLGAQVRGESLDAPVIVSVGGRLYYGSAGGVSVGGFGIGAGAEMMPESWNGFGFGLYGYFVPSVVSFGDSDGLSELGVTFNFQVTEQAMVQLGLQRVAVSLTGTNAGTHTIDDGFYLGLNVLF